MYVHLKGVCRQLCAKVYIVSRRFVFWFAPDSGEMLFGFPAQSVQHVLHLIFACNITRIHLFTSRFGTAAVRSTCMQVYIRTRTSFLLRSTILSLHHCCILVSRRRNFPQHSHTGFLVQSSVAPDGMSPVTMFERISLRSRSTLAYSPPSHELPVRVS